MTEPHQDGADVGTSDTLESLRTHHYKNVLQNIYASAAVPSPDDPFDEADLFDKVGEDDVNGNITQS